jgi:hypothetical protein
MKKPAKKKSVTLWIYAWSYGLTGAWYIDHERTEHKAAAKRIADRRAGWRVGPIVKVEVPCG